jgi:16S rRNA (guanine527-N7)-methyltransferase
MKDEVYLEGLIRETFPEIGMDSISKILIFYREVLKWNQAINLISRRDQEATAVKLIIDALFLTKILIGNERVLDIGAGAGIPGVPVLLSTNVEMFLAESRQKRAAFLSRIVHLLRLKQAHIINETMDVNSATKLGRFHMLWSKAAIPLEALFSLGQVCLDTGGRLILFRPFQGKKEKASLKALAEVKGFSIPVFRVYSCPELYLTRTITVCQKNRNGKSPG